MNTITHATIHGAAQHKATELFHLLQDLYKDEGLLGSEALLMVSLMGFMGVEDSTFTSHELIGEDLPWDMKNEHQKHNSKVLEVFQDRFLKHAN
jgi:hypothetical protein